MSNMFHIFMLFYVVHRYICISVPHTASTVPSFLFFTAQKINIMIYFYYMSLTATTAKFSPKGPE